MLSPPDKSTTIPVANPFVIVYVLLGVMSARETKFLGRIAAIAAGIASRETIIDVNFMMERQGRGEGVSVSVKGDEGRRRKSELGWKGSYTELVPVRTCYN